jgi:hypothetical protein
MSPFLFVFTAVVCAVVKNSEAVATFLEAELSSSNCVGCITVDSEELAKKNFMSKAGILDVRPPEGSCPFVYISHVSNVWSC